MAAKTQLDTIESAIEALRNGEVIIVMDDEDRENEGDFLTSCENATPEVINFMATHGRGLICAPLVEDRCDKLGLEMMVQSNTAQFETPFTVSIDLVGYGTTTGISASDRSKTVKALIDPNIKPSELGKPGHIFPLRARKGGVLRRAGHTEAAVDFSRLAGFEPAGVIVEIMNEDGTMARKPELMEIAAKFNLRIVTIKDLIAYRIANESLIERVMDSPMPTRYGNFQLHAFRQVTDGSEHMALVKGEWTPDEAVMVRVHSSSMIGDVFGSKRFGRGDQLHSAMEMIEKEGKGVIVYISRHQGDEGLVSLMQRFAAAEENEEVSAPARMDVKDFGIGAQILRDLGVRKIRRLSNNPKPRKGLIAYGLEIVEDVRIPASD